MVELLWSVTALMGLACAGAWVADLVPESWVERMASCLR
jgi:hypothetical protein